MAISQKWARPDLIYDGLIKKIECQFRKHGCFHEMCVTDQEWFILRIMCHTHQLMEHGAYIYPDIDSPKILGAAANDFIMEELKKGVVH